MGCYDGFVSVAIKLEGFVPTNVGMRFIHVLSKVTSGMQDIGGRA